MDREAASANEYKSQGISECTGIKSMDYAEAEKRARENLGRIVNVQVKSEIVSIRRDDGMNGGASYSGQITSEHISSVLLKNSEIFSHWIDPQTCSIHAGVRISKTEIANAIQENLAAEKRKLKNQPWHILSSGIQAELVINQLGIEMSRLGVTTRNESTDFSLSATIIDIDIQQDRRLARVSLKLEARNRTDILWNRQIQGKGVSFKEESDAVLLKSAVQDALENSRAELENLMQQSTKP